MTDAEKILEMINSVKKNDTEKLNEIDARFWCYLEKISFIEIESNYIRFFYKNEIMRRPLEYAARFTRSRDALKKVRPDGWQLTLDEVDGEHWKASLMILDPKNGNVIADMEYVGITEELAELHVIIQSTEWSRKNDK